jgi:hypothetical protein
MVFLKKCEKKRKERQNVKMGKDRRSFDFAQGRLRTKEIGAAKEGNQAIKGSGYQDSRGAK